MKITVIIFVLILCGSFEDGSTASNRRITRQEIIASKLTFGTNDVPNLLSSSANAESVPKVDLSEPFVVPMLLQSGSNQSETIFSRYKSKYGFRFSSDKVEREVKKLLVNKIAYMSEHNVAYENEQESYAVAIDGYSVLDIDEFLLLRTGLNPKAMKKMKKTLKVAKPKLTKKAKALKAKALKASNLPKAVSIIDSPYYPPVQNQLTCGSCWAFSAVALFNYQINVKKGDRSSDLSVQQLVDCDTTNSGCNGGLPDKLFKSLVNSGFGVVNAKDYPYMNKKLTCSKPLTNESFRIVQEEGQTSGGPSGWGLGTEDELAEMVYKYGAVVIGVAVQDGFISYSKGIYNGCKKPNKLNHAVVLVGFGVKSGKKFWIIRNSWGIEWGEKGHIRILRGVQMCGISMYYTAATIDLI